MCNSHRDGSGARNVPAIHPILCILPPHMLDAIAKNGTAAQRAAALATLATDETIRSLRAEEKPAPRALRLVAPKKPAVPKKRRTVYDAAGAQQLPGKVVRREGGKSLGDVAVDEAYAGLGATFDFYLANYRRNSIDDAGFALKATVHYGIGYDNAFWNGRQMVFGDGDGKLFNRFTSSLDVIGHELAHGVTAHEAGLVYLEQPGALNESLSDVFGSLIKQHSLNQDAAQADWLIGASLFTPNVKGVALRSMKAPGTAYDDPVLGRDPQPAHMKDLVVTTRDNGGVHINSGIPNRAFHLAATAIGGKAWETTGRIWYETLRDPKLKADAKFAAFARLTVETAARLYTAAGKEAAAVADAWKQVGVL
jgi:Zn-dependent metalloprotease